MYLGSCFIYIDDGVLEAVGIVNDSLRIAAKSEKIIFSTPVFALPGIGKPAVRTISEPAKGPFSARSNGAAQSRGYCSCSAKGHLSMESGGIARMVRQGAENRKNPDARQVGGLIE